MQTTPDTANKLMDLVKAKAKREGFSVPFVTETLYKAWLINAMPLPPYESPVLSPEQAEKWIEGLKSEAVEIARNPADPRTLREIFNEGRR